MDQIHGWAAHEMGQRLEKYSYDPGPLGAEDVEIEVDFCGICHSDLSVIDNEWGNAQYPIVPGHEVVGRVIAVGTGVKGVMIGQRVGVGWNSGSCMHCTQCLGGDHQLCPSALATIIGHFGGFAQRMRAHWAWTIPMPENIEISTVGPLLCGGITVFSPLWTFGVKPTDHVGIIGIGGLGHMAIKFASAWGCEVTAFTSSESKYAEAKAFGAHHVLTTGDAKAIAGAAGTLDMLISTVNVSLDWPSLIQMLKPKGRLHVVGAVLEPMAIPAFSLIMGQKQVSGSPTGSPTVIAKMLEFAARHKIEPQVEHFALSDVNAALDHLRQGKARYRIVLDAKH